MAQVSTGIEVDLEELETAFRTARTGPRSTPFLVEIPISEEVRRKAELVVGRIPIATLFHKCPTVATWAVLTPLAENYGLETNKVYQHFSRYLRGDFSDQPAREDLKGRYRRAARAIGLPVSGNDPTPLFFDPLGPPRSKHHLLAGSFIKAALNDGPPPLEDTTSARAWQKRAVQKRYPNEARLIASVAFDKSAHLARRFEAWRKEEAPLNDIEAELFKAYWRAMKFHHHTRADIIGPPRIYWSDDRLGLGLEFEPSRDSQSFKTGIAPVQVRGGDRRSVDAPWAETITWSHRGRDQDIPFGLAAGDLLVFDADTGILLAREKKDAKLSEVAAERLVVLAKEPFSAPSFGEAMPAEDPDYHVAWVEAGETLSFQYGRELTLEAPSENAIWIDSTPIGRDRSRALLAGDGALVVKLDPQVGGRTRIVRARIGDEVKFAEVNTDDNGAARIPFSDFALAPETPPGKVVFEVLAPGAAGDLDARAEVLATGWIWPGMTTPEGALAEMPCPENYIAARSAGLRREGDRLFVDLRAETQVLGLEIEGRTREVTLTVKADRAWHFKLESGERVLIPRGKMLTFGHAQRGDRILVESTDRAADLLVLGQHCRRPFRAHNRFEIDPDMLKHNGADDDRIALRQADGRLEILARIRRVDDPSDLDVEETEDEILLTMVLPKGRDAVEVCIEDTAGNITKGFRQFGRTPVPEGLPSGVSVEFAVDSRRLQILIDKTRQTGPAKVSFAAREEGRDTFTPLVDLGGARIVLGIGGTPRDPGPATLERLASFLAEPVPAALEEQVATSIGAAYESVFRSLGAARMVGSVRAALVISRPDGQPPRHDIVSVAPWVFEAQPHAYRNLPEKSWWAPLSRITSLPPVADLPDPDGETPLSTWLSRVRAGHDVPEEFGAAELQSAFRLLRHYLRETDLSDLVGEDRIGATTRLICAAWSDDIEALRAFDTGGGGDENPARIAVAIERFARSAAMRRTEKHLEDLVFRTGLPRAEIGRSLTLMLRAGVNFLLYFRALWSQAQAQHEGRQ